MTEGTGGSAVGDWIPVIKSSHDSWLGVMPDGTLGVGKENEGRATLEASGYVAMWPFLERSLDACLEEFSGSWQVLGGHGVATPERLIELTVASAVERGRPYWMALTVPWLIRMTRMARFDSRLVLDLVKSTAGRRRFRRICERKPGQRRRRPTPAILRPQAPGFARRVGERLGTVDGGA